MTTGDLETDVQRLLDDLRVRTVLELYCRLLDDSRFDELLELFHDRCVVEMMGRRFDGREELATVWVPANPPATRQASLHAISNPEISIEGNTATSICNWTMTDRSGEDGSFRVVLAGRYVDLLKRLDTGRWQIAERAVTVLGRPLSSIDPT